MSIPLASAASLPVSTATACPPSLSASPPAATPLPGRTRHGLALGLAAASVVPVVLGGASAAPASAASSATTVSKPDSVTADQQPACGDPEAGEFPITTRIHSGPDTYASGGGYGTWYLDLTNTTTESCRAIHPVLVLTDEERKLTSDQIQLEFADQDRPDVQHRVIWETTDQDEHIGVFGGDSAEDAEDADSFAGFTVPAGRTVTVEVRMAFTSDTGPGRITARAAIVQRQQAAGGKTGNDDGAWVGESDDYSFSVVDDSDSYGDETGDTQEVGGTGDVPRDTPRDALPDGALPTSTSAPAPTSTSTRDAPARPVASGRTPAASDRPERPDLPQLAATGPAAVPHPGITVAGFLIGGGAMVLWSRRLRRRP
ncbi:hypothetical protein [Streptomyces sp. NBC_01217]|uniref:hypothetical protein n=1 Tax=Streptomyces sp. NBC_01217 TaxID=2903779 RepID=UPI002E139C47